MSSASRVGSRGPASGPRIRETQARLPGAQRNETMRVNWSGVLHPISIGCEPGGSRVQSEDREALCSHFIRGDENACRRMYAPILADSITALNGPGLEPGKPGLSAAALPR